MVIGFEMFPRRVQPVLDQWVAGSLTAQEFLKQTEWDKVWFPPHLHAPVRIRPINKIPMRALNVEIADPPGGGKGWTTFRRKPAKA